MIEKKAMACHVRERFLNRQRKVPKPSEKALLRIHEILVFLLIAF
jgi:hypothetical protein